MLDLAYVLFTVAFFTLMLAYVRACAAIGRGANAVAPADHPSHGGTL